MLRKNPNKSVTVVYDGDCPVCKNIVAVTRLRDSKIELNLVNARNVKIYDLDWFPKSANINNDMVVKINNNIFLGADAMHALSLLSSKSTFLNYVTFTLFKIKPLAKLFYPIMRICRKLLLKLLRISPLKNNKS